MHLDVTPCRLINVYRNLVKWLLAWPLLTARALYVRCCHYIRTEQYVGLDGRLLKFMLTNWGPGGRWAGFVEIGMFTALNHRIP